MRLRFTAILAVVLLASGCDGSGAEGTRPPGTGGCPNQDDVLSAGSVRGDPLVGDVTGDGRDDVVTLIVDPDAEPDCQAFVSLERKGEGEEAAHDVLPIQQTGMEVGGPVDLPRPVALLEVDDRPGAEVVAILIAGAATEFAALFSYGGGSFARLEVEGGESFAGLFPHGGTASQQQASDCAGEGEVIASAAVLPSADAKRYLVTRTFFVREEDSFLADLSRTEVHEDVPPSRVRRFPEFTGGLFASCPTA